MTFEQEGQGESVLTPTWLPLADETVDWFKSDSYMHSIV